MFNCRSLYINIVLIVTSLFLFQYCTPSATSRRHLLDLEAQINKQLPVTDLTIGRRTSSSSSLVYFPLIKVRPTLLVRRESADDSTDSVLADASLDKGTINDGSTNKEIGFCTSERCLRQFRPNLKHLNLRGQLKGKLFLKLQDSRDEHLRRNQRGAMKGIPSKFYSTELKPITPRNTGFRTSQNQKSNQASATVLDSALLDRINFQTNVRKDLKKATQNRDKVAAEYSKRKTESKTFSKERLEVRTRERKINGQYENEDNLKDDAIIFDLNAYNESAPSFKKDVSDPESQHERQRGSSSRTILTNRFAPWGGKRSSNRKNGRKGSFVKYGVPELRDDKFYYRTENRGFNNNQLNFDMPNHINTSELGQKRKAFNPWGGKRVTQPSGRIFAPWGGKRTYTRES